MKMRITVQGVAYEVEVEILDAGDGIPSGSLPPLFHQTVHPPVHQPITESARPHTTSTTTPASLPATANSVAAPLAGSVVELKCGPGDQVSAGQALVIIEAMKMNTTIAAPTAGLVKAVNVAVGDAIREGQILVEMG